FEGQEHRPPVRARHVHPPAYHVADALRTRGHCPARREKALEVGDPAVREPDECVALPGVETLRVEIDERPLALAAHHHARPSAPVRALEGSTREGRGQGRPGDGHPLLDAWAAATSSGN